jgi:hypothetical protein
VSAYPLQYTGWTCEGKTCVCDCTPKCPSCVLLCMSHTHVLPPHVHHVYCWGQAETHVLLLPHMSILCTAVYSHTHTCLTVTCPSCVLLGTGKHTCLTPTCSSSVLLCTGTHTCLTPTCPSCVLLCTVTHTCPSSTQDGHLRVRHVCVTVHSSTQDGHVGVRNVCVPVPRSTQDGHVTVRHVCVCLYTAVHRMDMRGKSKTCVSACPQQYT